MPSDTASRTFRIDDPSVAGEARRAAASLAAVLGFDATRQGELAIVVSEAAKNLAAHAGGGELLLRPLSGPDAVGVEVLAIDAGPGMADVARCLRDGYSTAGTAGIGLGAMERLSSTFDIYSAPGKGTVVACRLWQRAAPAPGGWDVGLVSVPKPGEQVCGDGWGVEQTPGRSLAMVADGLGHGPAAREASAEAERLFHEQASRPAAEILDRMHGALRSTRGASVAIAECDWASDTISIAGVGNISVTVISGDGARSAISHNGTVGHQVRKIQTFTYAFPQGAILLIYSDGLMSQVRLDDYPGLTNRSPAVIAGVLYRDFRRTRDDATVLVARAAAPEASP